MEGGESRDEIVIGTHQHRLWLGIGELLRVGCRNV